MAYQAITTRYYGPTNTRGSRIKATAQAGSAWWSYDHALNTDRNHQNAARVLAEKFGWAGKWFEGGAPDGCGNVYVWVPETAEAPAFVVEA